MKINTEQQNESFYTLSTWLEKWLITYKRCSVKDATYNNYKYVVSLIKKTPEANIPIKDITELDLQSVINEVFKNKPSKSKEGDIYSKSTMKTVRLSIKQALRIAFRQHLIVEYPCEVLTLPVAPTKLILPLTEDEQIKVENACHLDPLGHLFIFLLRTGLRRAELMQLKWEDYDEDNQEIYIRKSKTKAGIRTVSLLNEAKRIIENQPHINAYIFNNTRLTPVTESVLRKLYTRLREKTGVMHLTNHVCRHTFVTRLCEKSINPKVIAQIIGHAKTDYVMDIYAMIEKKQLQLAIYKLDNNYSETERNSNYTVQLPPSLYKQAVNYASQNGIELNTYINNTIKESLTTKVDNSKIISFQDIIKKN